ncbi:hypothetical protein [Edaphobacter sp.]|uniref:hypothetical protein n=1 Tax=Edaphobacter sp. TaxID=1934404 RepID=UPI002DBD7BC1|nr:hypothetical protein [Edaphobacter sp.]HEU5339612.1 hypothetical protein [Edaphobacter sp.]
MTEPHSPTPPETRNSGPSFFLIVVIIAVFFLFVFIISVLLLPDKGRRLLRLTQANPVTETVACGPPAPRALLRSLDQPRIR